MFQNPKETSGAEYLAFLPSMMDGIDRGADRWWLSLIWGSPLHRGPVRKSYQMRQVAGIVEMVTCREIEAALLP
jgi:hypothetical protein